MAGEIKDNGEDKTPPAMTAEEAQALRDEVKGLKDRNAEYERLLLDPAYLEYIAGSGGTGKGRREAARAVGRQAGDDKNDFEAMSQKELVDYILQTVRGEVRQAVVPVAQEAQFREMQSQVKEASGKYPDFWDYKEDMVKLAKQHPTLTAEQAYHLAKGAGTVKPKRPARPTEAPRGGA